MATKKTIAIVGATGDAGKAIVNRFASMAYRLLLVSDKPGELKRLTEAIATQYPAAEVESIECVRDGCWEADIIMVAIEGAEEQKVAELMKEVATQKIVVVVTQNENECKEMKRLLPYSKIVKAFINLDTNEIVLSGNCETVNEEIAIIFIQVGYQPVINTIKL
jgi:predicted dinucleotide-binding enzyme